MKPKSNSARKSSTPPKLANDDQTPELRELLAGLRTDGFDLIGRVRPIHKLVELQTVIFDRLQDGGLKVADIAELLMQIGIVGPDGTQICDGTLRSALSRARGNVPRPAKATTRSTWQQTAAVGHSPPQGATRCSGPPSSAAERVNPQALAAGRADPQLAETKRNKRQRADGAGDRTQHPITASNRAQPIEATEGHEQSSVQIRANLWNNASRS